MCMENCAIETYSKDDKPKFKIVRNILNLRKVVTDVGSKNSAL